MIAHLHYPGAPHKVLWNSSKGVKSAVVAKAPVNLTWFRTLPEQHLWERWPYPTPEQLRAAGVVPEEGRCAVCGEEQEEICCANCRTGVRPQSLLDKLE